MTASAVYAHIPTSVSLGSETESQITISWTHATDDSCGSGCDGITDVDIIRTPGQIGSTNTSVSITNATSYVVANNATGLSSWVDHSLPSGTYFMYEVCHPDPDTSTCATADTNSTHASGTEPLWTTTKASAPTDILLTPGPTTIDVRVGPWLTNTTNSPAGNFANNTAVVGLKIEYSTDNSSYTTASSNSTGFTGSQDNPQYTIESLSQSTKYWVRVSGVSDGSSASGNVAGTTTVLDPVFTTAKKAGTANADPRATSYSVGDVTSGNLKVTLKEDRGWDRILNTVLYTNISADQGTEASDTYITWNFFDGVSVTDPHGYFNDVDVVGERSGVRTQDFTYEITWNKSLGANDVIIETKDFQSNAGLTIIENAWTSFPVKQVSHEIPEETSEETMMALYVDGGVMNHVFLTNDIDYALVSDMKYFIQDGIIDVSQDEVVLEQEEGVIELFEDVTLRQKSMKIGSEYIKTLVVSGTVNTKVFSAGNAVTFNIIGPDGSESKVNAVTTSDRTFEVPIVLEGLKSGTYQLLPVHDIHSGEALSFRY
jgi:hypothetical protein